MRRIHFADVACAARALQKVAPEDRADLCLRMIREAQCADAHRRETGRAHPLWGCGSLMEVARRRAMAPDRGFDDYHFCQALGQVLEGLLAAGIRQRRS